MKLTLKLIQLTLTNQNDLQNILQRINEIMRNEVNMKINKKNTKILMCSTQEENRLRTTTIRIENQLLEQARE